MHPTVHLVTVVCIWSVQKLHNGNVCCRNWFTAGLRTELFKCFKLKVLFICNVNEKHFALGCLCNKISFIDDHELYLLSGCIAFQERHAHISPLAVDLYLRLNGPEPHSSGFLCFSGEFAWMRVRSLLLRSSLQLKTRQKI